MRRIIIGTVLLALLAGTFGPAGAASTTRHGDLEFPRDEHQHLNGWDYWWGAADLHTEQGNQYTVGIAFVSFNGAGATGHQIYAHQGPYAGGAILTEDGPAEWGHPRQNDYVREISAYVPDVSELLRYSTLDPTKANRDVGRWERTTLDSETYRFVLDHDAAEVHPAGDRVAARVDIEATMRSPLLAGGTGTWWYGLPETYGYPSRSFQYMQGSRAVTGTIAIEQPDGTIADETVDVERSTILMVHEYDATPEDLFGGLAVAEATQLHPRYAQYYPGGMPWELIFLDLDNGAQLMIAVLAFHDTPDGTVAPVVGPDQATYRVMATLRLPDGTSLELPDDSLRVEHLSYRDLVGKVPTFAVAVTGVWKQSWDYRVGYPGGTVTGPDGAEHEVPAFDLGVTPQIGRDRPGTDAEGNGQTQRVPFVAAGSYGDCPVEGFGWSELIINWYGRDDPWASERGLPPVPAECTSVTDDPPAPTGDLDPAARERPPDATWEGCSGYRPGGPTECTYVATTNGGVGGTSATTGGWTVTIRRPGRADPIVVTSFGGMQSYGCGTIRPGDTVELEVSGQYAGAIAGNPAICV